MKVLHVLDHSLPLHSGYTFRTRSILTIQHQMGIKTAMITGCKHAQNSACVDAIEYVDGLTFYRTYPTYLSKIPGINQLDVVLTLNKRLESVIARERPDILHAHSPCLNGLAALHAGKKHGIPVLYEMRASWEDAAVSHGTCTENDLRYKISRALETYVLKRADHITTICEGLKGDIQIRGIPSEKMTVIPNAVNIDQFKPITEKDTALLTDLKLEGKKIYGFIGSFYEYEGLELLVKAMPALKNDYPDLHLLLVGGGQTENKLKAMVAQLDLSGHVTFTGRINHKEVMRYYSIIDLLVYPRLSMRLTDLVTPLKPLEAMAMGRPCLASDVGGHKELIIDQKDGLLFKAGDIDSLISQLRQAYTTSNFDVIIRNGLDKVKMERNWNVSAAPYKSIYTALLHKQHTSR
ncbi:MAG: glycosyltransferase, exosortase A system-associated [Nitrosomonas sp.]|nr:glycosyltransferase, exosortase A system-associated [Nitrosomonas sp.]MBX3640473.1 glycosyltransferase, exosortase A system-associated [Nitrosomonas sp.]MCW5607017.1 glycosyltransferase, exosortase A system-associated [Nitrosomonas sp.]MCW5619083.1 glycosyltransferase, exosortase A system-associated [Nitrosomonas sp.]